jgi:hypothetical protein
MIDIGPATWDATIVQHDDPAALYAPCQPLCCPHLPLSAAPPVALRGRFTRKKTDYGSQTAKALAQPSSPGISALLVLTARASTGELFHAGSIDSARKRLELQPKAAMATRLCAKLRTCVYT